MFRRTLIRTAGGLAVAAATRPAFAATPLIDEIKARGTLRAGLSTFVPWAMRDKTGKLIGYELDVGARLAADLGAFNKPSITVAARRGTAAATTVQEKLPLATLRQFDDDAPALQEVLNGNAAAWLTSTPKPAFAAIDHPESLYLPLEKPITAQRDAMAIRKGEAATTEVINKWIAARSELTASPLPPRLPPPDRASRRRFGWLDLVVLLAVAGLLAFVGFRVQTVLNYRWAWSSIPNYLVRYDPDRGWVANLLLQGLLTTLRLSLWSLVLAAVFGVLIASGRIARGLLPRLVSGAYVELMRNTPPLVLIFVGYFFVSSQIMPLLGIDAALRAASPGALQVVTVAFGEPRLLKNFLSATIVLALFEGAYIAEILRGGTQSIEPGQWDAASALGLTRLQSLRLVVLPQAISRMIPPLGGQTISLIKDSSVISLISIQDLTFMANEVAVSTTRVFETWITASAMGSWTRWIAALRSR
eukprot:gene4295-4345_t